MQLKGLKKENIANYESLSDVLEGGTGRAKSMQRQIFNI